MTIAQIISAAMFIIILYSMTREKSDVLSPAKTFILIWAVMVFLVEFKFSKFQSNWSSYAWFVLGAGLFSFLQGIYISFSLNANRKLFTIQEIRQKVKDTPNYDTSKFFFAFTILFTLYFVSLILEFIIMGYIPLFHPQPDISRTEFGVFGIHLFVNQMPVILLMGIEYFIIKRSGRLTKILTLLFMSITFISYFLILVRFNYIYWILMSFALLYYATNFINLKRALLSGAAFIGFFYILMSIRLSQYASQYLHITSKMKYSAKYAEFSGIYMYLIMNLENLARAVDKIEDHTYSVMTFDWIYALTGLKYWIRNYVNYDPRPFIISGYNTFPFLMEYYYDFGLTGLIVFPMLSGIIIGLLYYRFRTNGSLDSIVYYSFCFFLIVISFFVNPLTMLSIVSNLFVIWVIHRYFLFKTVITNDSLTERSE